MNRSSFRWSSFLIPTSPLVIKLRIFRNEFLFFSHFYVEPTTIPIHVHVSKHKRTQEWKSILLFLYPFQVSKHAIILWVFKTSRRRRRRLHHHHQPLFNITITITTLSSQLGLLVVKDSSLWLQDLHAIHTVYFDLAFKFMPLCCLFIFCIS